MDKQNKRSSALWSRLSETFCTSASKERSAKAKWPESSVGNESLLAEVIEIAGNEAKIQVFEDTRGVKFDTPVHFAGHLLRSGTGAWAI